MAYREFRNEDIYKAPNVPDFSYTKDAIRHSMDLEFAKKRAEEQRRQQELAAIKPFETNTFKESGHQMIAAQGAREHFDLARKKTTEGLTPEENKRYYELNKTLPNVVQQGIQNEALHKNDMALINSDKGWNAANANKEAIEKNTVKDLSEASTRPYVSVFDMQKQDPSLHRINTTEISKNYVKDLGSKKFDESLENAAGTRTETTQFKSQLAKIKKGLTTLQDVKNSKTTEDIQDFINDADEKGYNLSGSLTKEAVNDFSIDAQNVLHREGISKNDPLYEQKLSDIYDHPEKYGIKGIGERVGDAASEMLDKALDIDYAHSVKINKDKDSNNGYSTSPKVYAWSTTDTTPVIYTDDKGKKILKNARTLLTAYVGTRSGKDLQATFDKNGAIDVSTGGRTKNASVLDGKFNRVAWMIEVKDIKDGAIKTSLYENPSNIQGQVAGYKPYAELISVDNTDIKDYFDENEADPKKRAESIATINNAVFMLDNDRLAKVMPEDLYSKVVKKHLVPMSEGDLKRFGVEPDAKQKTYLNSEVNRISSEAAKKKKSSSKTKTPTTSSTVKEPKLKPVSKEDLAIFD